MDSNGGWLERFFRRWNQWVQVIWNVPSLEDDPKKFDVKALEINYEGRNVVAYVGGLMHEKGLRVAIEMAAKVKDYHPEVLFLFIGPMKDDPKEIEKLIRRNGLNKHIRILRLMPYRKMLAHLRHALIGLALSQQARIYPLVSAGNGRKFFTYMQAGLAIIGPEFGEIGKAVKMADCGVLVNTESPQAVADAVSRLLDNPDELKRLRRNARAAFEQRFNWEKERPKFVRFIAEVMR